MKNVQVTEMLSFLKRLLTKHFHLLDAFRRLSRSKVFCRIVSVRQKFLYRYLQRQCEEKSELPQNACKHVLRVGRANARVRTGAAKGIRNNYVPTLPTCLSAKRETVPLDHKSDSLSQRIFIYEHQLLGKRSAAEILKKSDGAINRVAIKIDRVIGLPKRRRFV